MSYTLWKRTLSPQDRECHSFLAWRKGMLEVVDHYDEDCALRLDTESDANVFLKALGLRGWYVKELEQ